MEPEVPQDSFNPDKEWGPAGCDVRHRFVASLIYQIPLSASSSPPSSTIASALTMTTAWRRPRLVTGVT